MSIPGPRPSLQERAANHGERFYKRSHQCAVAMGHASAGIAKGWPGEVRAGSRRWVFLPGLADRRSAAGEFGHAPPCVQWKSDNIRGWSLGLS
jgi:hypothetical protein